MLKLQNILKVYVTGDTQVTALKNVSITFRQSEFVSILGPSGCGKTTLLNIIGGLDRYTDGDLSINGVSTKQYEDHDWDTYRNHSVGFVFQSYNLIPHQSVLANVELALTLSGVSREERRNRAKAALEKVGLGDQLHKKPSQMSGGQMQRVAIARALVNDPEILLADEPTGALDSDTSVQIMELLKEVAKDRLVIMVTHNPDLADQYSNRIIRLLDGEVVDDTNPYTVAEVSTERDAEAKKPKKKKGTSMSFFTALSLSFNNLLTKKTRTLLTSFAGSIGIIGIALILALSTGVNLYINQVQQDTLSSYPISIEAETIDMSSLLLAFAGQQEESDSEPHPLDKIYGSSAMYDLVNSLNKMQTQKNNLTGFKAWLEAERKGGDGAKTELYKHLSAIQYVYDLNLNVLVKDTDGKVLTSDISGLMNKLMAEMASYMGTTAPGGSASTGSDSILSGGTSSNASNGNGGISSLMSMSQQSGNNVWQEMISGNDGELVHPLLKEQYDLVGDGSRWPTAANEVVLVVNSQNELSDFVLYALGLKTEAELLESFRAVMNKEEVSNEGDEWTYEKILGLSFKAIPTSEFFRPNANGGYTDIRNSSILVDEAGRIEEIYNRGTELKIVGIIRPNPDAASNMITGSICYTAALTEQMINYVPENADGEGILQKQLAAPTIDIFTGRPFLTKAETDLTEAQKAAKWIAFLASTDAQIQDAKVKAFKSWYTSQSPSEDELNGKLDVMAQMGMFSKQAIIKQYAGQLAAEENLTQAEAEARVTAELAATGLTDEQLSNFARLAAKEMLIQQDKQARKNELSGKPETEIAQMYDAQASSFTEAELAGFYDTVYLSMKYAEGTYEDNLVKLGHVDMASPKTIHIYAATFEAKDAIDEIIKTSYNAGLPEEDQIKYTDYVKILMSSITTIINAISYVLIAFVSISLVVSSIMIGIITYISVLERTKEIGILRAIGASKRDVSRVFNAETLIVGFGAGALGILITLLLCIPINLIVRALTDIESLTATLPVGGAIFLVVLSMVLTLIAGLLPSRLAAKKDPVVALRSE